MMRRSAVTITSWGSRNRPGIDPYDTNPYCAKPFMLVISDINPSFDSDQLPGSAFPGAIAGDLAAGDERSKRLRI